MPDGTATGRGIIASGKMLKNSLMPTFGLNTLTTDNVQLLASMPSLLAWRRVDGVLPLTFLRAGFLSLSLTAAMQASAQNLVPNPSYEDTASCGGWINSAMETAPPWFRANEATPDVYGTDTINTCGYTMDPNDPNMVEQGLQYPFHGGREAGAYLYQAFGSVTKDYLAVRLMEPLVPGSAYAISVRLSRAELSRYAVARFGAWFTIDSVSEPGFGVLAAAPQVEFHDPAFFTDDTGWMLASGMFVASGGEEYLVIGSFEDNASMVVQEMLISPWWVAYYYFDSVNVSLIGESGLEELVVWQEGRGSLAVMSGGPQIEAATLFDITGKTVATSKAAGTRIALRIPPATTSGIYVVQVARSDGMLMRRKTYWEGRAP